MNTLIHHGIKGQKWGIRRYQNNDGSYTEEGKRRYGIKDEKKSKISIDVNTRKKIGKILAVTAGIAVTAVAAYYIGKNVGDIKAAKFFRQIKGGPESLWNTPLNKIDDTDIFIDVGQKLKRVSDNSVFESKNFDYMSYLPGDSEKYKQFLYPRTYEQTLKTTKTIKAISGRKQIKIFEELLKNPDFVGSLKMWNDFDEKHVNNNLSKVTTREEMESLAKAYYPLFMNTLGQGESNKSVKMYTDAIRKLGYNAMVDMNDKLLGVAESPIISLSSKDTLVQEGSKKISDLMLYFGALKL